MGGTHATALERALLRWPRPALWQRGVAANI